MVQALRLAGHEHVLEVGTGYGYQNRSACTVGVVRNEY